MSLRFALPAHGVSDAPAVAELTDAIGAQGVGEVNVLIAGSYDKLAAMMRSGEASFAWVPPLVFTGLERQNEATPLVSLRLDDSNAVYMSALIVRADSPLATVDELRGARVGWVDRWSASGYVVPRIALASEHADPRAVFGREVFLGSHDAVVRAVASGEVDVGATYARASNRGIESGPWTTLGASVRVLASWGPIPSDVVAASSSVDAATASNVRRALLALSRDVKGRALVRRVFGVDELQPWVSETYDAMRRAMTDAAKRGLLDELLR